MVYAVAVLWSADRLPADGVPLHFDASGLADRLDTRAEAVGLYLGLGALMPGIGIAAVAQGRWACSYSLRTIAGCCQWNRTLVIIRRTSVSPTSAGITPTKAHATPTAGRSFHHR